MERRNELGERIAAAVLSRVDYYETVGEEATARLLSVVLGDVDFLLTAVSDGGDIDGLDTTPAYHRGRHGAAEGFPLADLLQTHRVGGRLLWEAFAEEARRVSLDAVEVSRAASRVWEIHDVCMQAIAEGYADRSSELRVVDHDRSAVLMDTLFLGPRSDRRNLFLLAAGLRIPTEGPFVAVATELRETGENPMPEIEVALRARGRSSAWKLTSDALIGVVQVPGADTGPLISRLRAHAELRHGVSPTFNDLARARSAVRLARIALSGAAPTGDQVGIFDKQSIVMAAVSDPDIACQIRRRVLAGLDGMADEERAVLLETLEKWMDSGGSASVAATTLFCHPNTVRNRLRRIERATERLLTRPRDVAELCLALAAQRFAD
jgi:PucR C-terminal helix-turn-helix domain/GGDEF-like domain